GPAAIDVIRAGRVPRGDSRGQLVAGFAVEHEEDIGIEMTRLIETVAQEIRDCESAIAADAAVGDGPIAPPELMAIGPAEQQRVLAVHDRPADGDQHILGLAVCEMSDSPEDDAIGVP